MSIVSDLFLKKVMLPRLEHIKKVEDELAKRPDQIMPLEDAPVRFNHPERAVQSVLEGKMDLKGMVTPRLAPLFLSSMLGVLKANRSIADNPAHPRTEITPTELEELQALAKNLRRLVVDPDLVGRLGEAARRTYEEHLTLDRYLRDLDAVFSQIMADRR